MSKGLKIWLWVIFILNIISVVLNLLGGILNPISWLYAVLGVVFVVGIALILFKQKKLGFYMMCAMTAITFILNVVTGAGIVTSIISAVLSPLVTYLFMKETWDQFQ